MPAAGYALVASRGGEAGGLGLERERGGTAAAQARSEGGANGTGQPGASGMCLVQPPFSSCVAAVGRMIDNKAGRHARLLPTRAQVSITVMLHPLGAAAVEGLPRSWQAPPTRSSSRRTAFEEAAGQKQVTMQRASRWNPPAAAGPQQQQRRRRRWFVSAGALAGSSTSSGSTFSQTSSLDEDAWEEAYGHSALRYGMSLEQGLRETMEDAVQVVPHGRYGFFFASEFAAAALGGAGGTAKWGRVPSLPMPGQGSNVSSAHDREFGTPGACHRLLLHAAAHQAGVPPTASGLPHQCS